MAMRGLVEGECGAPNPLTKLRTHFSQDRGRLDPRPVHQTGRLGGSSLLTEQGLVQEFLAETHQVAARPPNTFRMDSLLEEMRYVEGMTGPRQAEPVSALVEEAGEAWAGEYLQTDQNVIDWSRQYLENNNLGDPDPIQDIHQDPRTAGWAQEYLAEVPLVEDMSSLAEPSLDPQEFDNFVASLGRGSTTKGASSVIEGAAGGAVKEQSHLQAAAWTDEFLTTAKADLEGGLINTDDTYKQEFWSRLESEWRDSDEDQSWIQDFTESYEPFKEYEFQKENPLSSTPNPLEEGKVKLREGDLPSAVLLFEEAVRQMPESIEAWQLLGTSQAENEQDPQAIAALKKCIALDPSNLAALMALAVSLTNESYQAQACQALTLWMERNPAYSSLTPTPTTSTTTNGINFTSSFMSKELHDKTSRLFLQAARQKTADIDADVQAGLGVLFNLSGDYDKAVDCFRAAVGVKPTDALLWNRLGATLANGDRSEEAIAAYRTALSHSPGFIRCRYNLGISCINLNAHREAIEHFLTALNFQASGRGPKGASGEPGSSMSDTIWSSLNLTLGLLNRGDLRPLAERRALGTLSDIFNIPANTDSQ